MSVPPVDPIPLPAPEPWLAVVLGATFLLHLIPMNLLLGCSFIAPAAAWLGRGPAGAPYRILSRQLTALLPVFMALAISLGVAPLLFLQVLYGRFFFTSSILMGWFWLAIIPLLLAAYALLYLAAWRRDPAGRGLPWVSLAAAAMLAAIAFLFTNNMTRMIRPETFGPVYRSSPRGLSLNLSDPTLWPRFLHFLLASLAVSGFFLAVLAVSARRRHGEEYAARALRLGSSLFVHPTFLQLLVGPWLLVRVPPAVRGRFLGGSAPETASLGCGVLCALAALVLMIQAPSRARPGAVLAAAGAAMVTAISLMVAVRHLLRDAALASVPGEAAVAAQPLAMAIFAGTLLSALGLILYIVWELWKAMRPRNAAGTGGFDAGGAIR